jgi:polyisoprenoid-binding protein YceI
VEDGTAAALTEEGLALELARRYALVQQAALTVLAPGASFTSEGGFMHIGMFAALLSLIFSLSFVPPVERVGVEGPPTGTWRLDPARSMVQFTVTKLGFEDVTGKFLDFSGAVRYDAANPGNSTVQWSVKIASVKTDARNRDRALQSVEYFDAARHPEMTFRSERVRPLGSGRLQVDGSITIRGKTRPLSIIAEPVAGGFESRFELNRYDFGIAGGTMMGRLIGRTVRVRLVAAAVERLRP